MFNILVVDDNDSIRKLITTYLLHDGYNVFAASDGLEALEILDKKQIDLMISDIMMPNMDGYTLTNELILKKYSLQGMNIYSRKYG